MKKNKLIIIYRQCEDFCYMREFAEVLIGRASILSRRKENGT